MQRLALVAWALAAGCVFDSSGLTTSTSPPPSPEAGPDLQPWPDSVPADADRGGRAEGLDSSPPPDRRPPDQLVPDSFVCTKQCSGCCEGNTCLPGHHTDSCGKQGAKCQSCGNKVCSNQVCTSCSHSTECPGDRVCTKGSCETAFDRDYTLTVYSATVMATKPDGSDWDVVSAPPDPVAEVIMSGSSKGKTATVWDTTSPYWAHDLSLRVSQTSKLTIKVSDDDIAYSEAIGNAELSGAALLSALHSGVAVVPGTSQLINATLHFTPK